MTKNYSISICLDKRYKKSDGTFPVKLRVFTAEPRTQKLFATIFSFTEKDFTSIWETMKPRTEHKETRMKLQALENKAHEVANNLPIFNFQDFERLMFGTTDREMNVNYYYERIIEQNRAKGNISTANNYLSALKCLLRFHSKPNIGFQQVTVSFLDQFEKHCIENEGKSITTVSIYLRTLRTVFNEAISTKTVSPDLYPFGKRKYQIKASKKFKRTLSGEQLKVLFEGVPKTPEQARAKAFWFFSYLCNGMNFKDILNLKWKDIDGDRITFIRAKTAKNSGEQTPIAVYLNPYSKEVIDTYGNTDRNENSFVFPILFQSHSAEEKHSKKNAFIRSVNQNFLKYSKGLGIEEQISTYFARHSFSTMAVRKGKSMEFVGEALGHTDIKTTMNYFAGFEDKDKMDISNALLNFN
jgi:integrase/recombinase XerD